MSNMLQLLNYYRSGNEKLKWRRTDNTMVNK